MMEYVLHHNRMTQSFFRQQQLPLLLSTVVRPATFAAEFLHVMPGPREANF